MYLFKLLWSRFTILWNSSVQYKIRQGQGQLWLKIHVKVKHSYLILDSAVERLSPRAWKQADMLWVTLNLWLCAYRASRHGRYAVLGPLPSPLCMGAPILGGGLLPSSLCMGAPILGGGLLPSPLCTGAPILGGGPVSTICLHLLIGFGQWEVKAGAQREGEQWGWVFNPSTSSRQGGPERAGLSSQSQRPSQAAHSTHLQLSAPHHPSSLRMNGSSLMQVRLKFGLSTGLPLNPLLCKSCLCKHTFLELSYFESAIYFPVGTD